MTSNPLLTLPDSVAIEHGLFARRGLDVVLAAEAPAGGGSAEAITGYVVDIGETDTFDLCEERLLDRLIADGRVESGLYLRAAVTTYALVAVDQQVQDPTDLAGARVVAASMSARTAARQILPDRYAADIDVIPLLDADEAVDLLHGGYYRAAVLLQPRPDHTAALGAHSLGQVAHRGTRKFEHSIPAEVVARYVAAVNEAVGILNTGVSEPAALTRFVPMVPYTRERLDREAARQEMLDFLHRMRADQTGRIL